MKASMASIAEIFRLQKYRSLERLGTNDFATHESLRFLSGGKF